MKKITVLMASVLAITTLLAAGLTVLPNSVQDAQANPCANEISRGGSADNAFNPQGDDERKCKFTGYFEFDEDETSDSELAATETDDAEATEAEGAEVTAGNNIINDPLFD
jgi:hypothetical protein